MKKFICGALAVLALAGCSSTGDKERQLELLASNRAGVLSSGLPTEHGPLRIMRATSNQNVVEIVMIYNESAKGAIPLQRLVNTSIHRYCTGKEVRSQLDMGLAYRLKIRNTRGQLMVDQLVTEETCQPKEKQQ